MHLRRRPQQEDEVMGAEPIGKHALKKLDPGNNEPSARGDNVERSKGADPFGSKAERSLHYHLKVALDRPKSVRAWLWFAGIRDPFYSTRHGYRLNARPRLGSSIKP